MTKMGQFKYQQSTGTGKEGRGGESERRNPASFITAILVLLQQVAVLHIPFPL